MSVCSMRDWLMDMVGSPLTEECEGYILGRGISEERMLDIKISQWDSSRVKVIAPDPKFADMKKGVGPRGERVNGWMFTPIWSPRGQLIGVEFRPHVGPKHLVQHLLPEAMWNPVFIGLTPAAMQRVWAGSDIWLVEGVFDMGALEHVVPKHDVVLATLRARVSERHALFLKRFCQGTVHIVYDNDDTGQRQTFGYVDPVTKKRRWGALDLLSRVGVKATPTKYNGGKDPGDIWLKGGEPALNKAFSFT